MSKAKTDKCYKDKNYKPMIFYVEPKAKEILRYLAYKGNTSQQKLLQGILYEAVMKAVEDDKFYKAMIKERKNEQTV